MRLPRSTGYAPTVWTLALAATSLACGGADERNPNPGTTLLDVVSEEPDLWVLRGLIATADIEEELSDPDAELMLLAPSNDAIAALSDATTSTLTADPELLAEVLRYHVVLERRGLGGLNPIDDDDVDTLQGTPVTIVGAPPRVIALEDATGARFSVVRGDISAGLSVVHIIDGLMLPGPLDARADGS